MFFGNQDNINQSKSPGLKICDNRLNKRVSDIFNVKEQISFHKPENHFENKRMSAQTNENRMNNKLRVT